MRRPVILLTIALSGLIAGPLYDQIHVLTGTLAYAHPWLWDQAWWVGPQFAAAFVVMGLATHDVELRFGPHGAPPADARRLACELGAFTAAYVVSGLFHERPWLVFVLLLVGLVARAVPRSSRPDRTVVITGIGLAIGGTLWESTLAGFDGTFTYAIPQLGNAPAWLPLLYLHGAPLNVSLTRRAFGGAAAE